MHLCSYCSLQFPLTALLESIDLFHGIKLHTLKYPPDMPALCWSLLCFLLCWHI